jgi:signal transduction histidine kinase
VLIQVSDQGIGIPPDARAHLFETFYRASNAAEFKGMGLGLAIAHHAVSRHDGTIEVESELGKGTTFTIRLPLRTG